MDRRRRSDRRSGGCRNESDSDRGCPGDRIRGCAGCDLRRQKSLERAVVSHRSSILTINTRSGARNRISRRAFVRIVAVLPFAAPLRVIAQASAPIRPIGHLWPGVADPSDEDLLVQALRELGWVEGRNLQVERRYANGRREALKGLVEELVRLKVEIIVTGGTTATLAAKEVTTTVPIVFEAAGDPGSWAW